MVEGPATGSVDRLHLADRLALRPKEAAEALGVSEKTLRKWMRNEGLPYFRLDGAVCIPVTELRGWMEQRVSAVQSSDRIADEILRAI
jgi:excisionase family DNA binding protein